MSAWSLHVWSFALLGAAGISFALFEYKRFNRLALVALFAGVIASAAVTLSGFLLVDGWTAQMEHFDFARSEPTMNSGRGSGSGMFALYSWPYETVALGGFLTYMFGRQLYRRIQTSTT